MQCASCKTTNEPDAVFCAECGRQLTGQTHEPAPKQRRPYLYALLFIPVIVLAAAVGYYKFFLPDGVAAVVNGEEIRLSELDAAVSRMRSQGQSNPVPPEFRYQALNELIAERLVLQEARRAGMEVSRDEVASAAAQAQAASGLDDEAFKKEMKSLYGSVTGFENALERRILISRLIAERVVPASADPQTASRAVNQWLRNLSGKAAVRIALAEQWSGGSCGCCNKGGGGPAQQKTLAGQRGDAGNHLSDKARAAADECLQYWRAKHGPEAVSTRVTDFGCHYQIDIVKDEKTIGSLRYQGGTITEM